MAMLPKQIAHHFGKELAVRQRPIRCRQPSVVAGDVCARDNEKEGRAGHQHCEAMNTPGHKDFGLRISDCGFWRNRLRTKEPFQIRNPQSEIVLSVCPALGTRSPVTSEASWVVRAT